MSYTNVISIFAAKNGMALLDKTLDMSPFCGTYFMFYVPINILLEMHKLFAIIFSVYVKKQCLNHKWKENKEGFDAKDNIFIMLGRIFQQVMLVFLSWDVFEMDIQ